MLIIARDPRLLSAFDLQAQDVPLLRHMLVSACVCLSWIHVLEDLE